MPTKRRGHHEGSIYQRADGRWVAAISVSKPGGRRTIVRRYRSTRNEAKTALRELQRQDEDGMQLATPSMRMDRYLEHWLTASVEQTVRPKTAAGYRAIVELRIAPELGRLRLSQINAPAIQGLYATLSEQGLAPRTVVNTHRVLRRAFSQAVRWGLLSRNPCDAVDPPKAPRTEMRTLSREQVDVLFVATVEDRLHALFVLALTTGMRLGELIGLAWSSIDLDAGRLQVRRSLQSIPGRGLMFTEPKTARSRRSIVLSQRAVVALREHRRRQLEERLAFPDEWLDPELVFCNYFGGPLSPGNVSNHFKVALKRAGLPVVRFHDMRHTAATLLLQAGTHPKVVADMLGHASISLTLDTYSHVVPALHEEAAATMDRLFGAS